VTEFPTAPRDSFIIANRDYVAQVTGRSAVQTLLVATSHPSSVAALIAPPAGAVVDDVTAPRAAVTSASGLAAGSLAGLDTLVSGYGQVLAIASGCLLIVVGAVQRRRALMTLTVVGADPQQRAGFVWTEARIVVVAGLVGGLAGGAVVAYELVRILKGIFDPPPAHMAVPVASIAILLVAVGLSSLLATAVSARWAIRADASRLRDI
jgi:putative ABC transport system permease protein